MHYVYPAVLSVPSSGAQSGGDSGLQAPPGRYQQPCNGGLQGSWGAGAGGEAAPSTRGLAHAHVSWKVPGRRWRQAVACVLSGPRSLHEGQPMLCLPGRLKLRRVSFIPLYSWLFRDFPSVLCIFKGTLPKATHSLADNSEPERFWNTESLRLPVPTPAQTSPTHAHIYTHTHTLVSVFRNKQQ